MQFNEIMSFVYTFLLFSFGGWYALRPGQHFFNHVGTLFCVPVLKQDSAEDNVSFSRDTTVPPVSLEVASLPSHAYEILILIA